MAITAQSIVLDVQTTLQDLTGTRWPAHEIVGYINDGQREIAAKRPDVTATQIAFVTAEGAEQALPAMAMSLIDVPRNTSGSKRAITKVDAALLDAFSRDWRGMTGVAEFSHFCYEPTDPRAFDLYPPASAGTSVQLLVSAYPTDVPSPTPPGVLASTVSGSISLGDEWCSALRNYAAFRAYSKDAEFGGNAALAGQFYQLFRSAIGDQLSSTTELSPKV